MKLRGGNANGQEYKVEREETWEWQNVAGIRFPLRFQRVNYIGPNGTPVSEYDLHIKNLQVNDRTHVKDQDFTLDALDLPDGTAGVDRRSRPIKRVTRSNGKVRRAPPGRQVVPRAENTSETGAGKGRDGGSGHPNSAISLDGNCFGIRVGGGGNRPFPRTSCLDPSAHEPCDRSGHDHLGRVAEGLTLIELMVVACVICILFACF